MIGAIFAVGEDGAFGNAGMVPWYLPDDFKHFKRVTLGGKIVMGRNTFESLPGILPNREHIVLSTGMDTTRNVRVYGDIGSLIVGEGNNFWVIGGPSVLSGIGESLGYDVVYLTTVAGKHTHDVSMNYHAVVDGMTIYGTQMHDAFTITKYINEAKF